MLTHEPSFHSSHFTVRFLSQFFNHFPQVILTQIWVVRGTYCLVFSLSTPGISFWLVQIMRLLLFNLFHVACRCVEVLFDGFFRSWYCFLFLIFGFNEKSLAVVAPLKAFFYCACYLWSSVCFPGRYVCALQRVTSLRYLVGLGNTLWWSIWQAEVVRYTAAVCFYAYSYIYLLSQFLVECPR